MDILAKYLLGILVVCFGYLIYDNMEYIRRFNKNYKKYNRKKKQKKCENGYSGEE